MWTNKMLEHTKMQRLNKEVVFEQDYRAQEIGEELLAYLKESDQKGCDVGLYLLESKFGYQKFQYEYSEKDFQKLERKWKKQKEWYSYLIYNEAIWDDLKYFPIPESSTDTNLQVSYSNGWMAERNYGGKRGHEGTDIMANLNESGLFPVISITDGVVTNIGWLEKGGYRIGITAPSGAYFYYAHLDSYANLKEGDRIEAGDLLGFMGDSGYGPEGTTGMFPVHLHLGMYIYPEGKEISVNPYWVLRYLEDHKVKCAYSGGDMK